MFGSVIPWTEAHQVLLSMGFSRQEYWNRLPFPPPGCLPDPGMEPTSPVAPALQADSLSLSHWGSPDPAPLMYLSYTPQLPWWLSDEEPAARQEPQETWVPPLGREDTLEEEVATRSSILAWRILARGGAWGAIWSIGSQGAGHY